MLCKARVGVAFWAATMARRVVIFALAATAMAGDFNIPANCVWGDALNDPRCDEKSYAPYYPACALYQYADRQPIPCMGLPNAGYCDSKESPTPAAAASWHVHIFFPNIHCTNCSEAFTKERAGFTFEGAMRFRQEIATFLNEEAQRIKGAPMKDPMDSLRALSDADYSQCIDSYHIEAGAPGAYHNEPCIYEVDMVKEMGPFTDPVSKLGYPNYSFFIPSDWWLAGLKDRLVGWLKQLRLRGRYTEYDVLVHPNTGCETRDHVDASSPDITWLGSQHALDAAIFSCNALGCNQACPSKAPPPANCSEGEASFLV
eukprot:TRINITY_DN49259_c0_g1_i1.p1 TRINITY_DN49259_c0_g1~~TRINITY_DN49259_c0_g1_i1.p1  ORF type:complete len:315 (+),score=20.52 TRINITY_DN49259_c0_g1_i1:71-1015(+)